jgi:hypothetical protein
MSKIIRCAVGLRAWQLGGVALSLIVVAASAEVARGQFGNNPFGNNVGGVSIDAAGMVSPPEKSARIPLRDALRKQHPAPAGDLNQAVGMRMVSLKRLEEAVQAAKRTTDEQVPDDVRFLAGLTRIQYVFVYPEEQDIVLAGPGEGWKVNEEGNIVGATTGRPVMLLEDLLIAFRSVEQARQGAISCSIDPTAEGRQRLEALSANRRGGGAPPLAQMKKALGPQEVTVSGVPADSHFARVLVSSDFHMKRIGMNLEPSSVKGLPSYIEMLKHDNSPLESATPRWWMACDYEPLGRSEDGLAFELRGRGVKCMAEDEVVDAQGRVSGTGSASSSAQKWADLMTEHYAELAAKEASFGELRNLMDLCVVAALVAKEQLQEKSNCYIPTIMSPGSSLAHVPFHSPKSIETLCSSVKRGNTMIVISGGVQISSWEVADKVETRPAVAQVRQRAKPTGSAARAWWNAGR